MTYDLIGITVFFGCVIGLILVAGYWDDLK